MRCFFGNIIRNYTRTPARFLTFMGAAGAIFALLAAGIIIRFNCQSAVESASAPFKDVVLVDKFTLSRNGSRGYVESIKNDFGIVTDLAMTVKLAVSADIKYFDTDSQPPFVLYGIQDFALAEEFLTKRKSLSSGRFFTADELASGAGVALIDENLAALNNISIGDSFTVTFKRDVYDFEAKTTTDKTTFKTVTVVGTVKDSYRQGDEKNNGDTANTIYLPFETAASMYGKLHELGENAGKHLIPLAEAAFRLEDYRAYKQLESRINEVYRPQFDIRLTSLQEEWEKDNAFLVQMKNVVTVLALAIILISFVLIGFLMIFNIQSRKREMYLLNTLGMKKLYIVIQNALEYTAAAAFAFIAGGAAGASLGLSAAGKMLSLHIININIAEETSLDAIISRENTASIIKSIEPALPWAQILPALLIGLLIVLAFAALYSQKLLCKPLISALSDND